MYNQGSKALAVAAVYRARQMNADTLGGLPLRPAVGGELEDTDQLVIETVLSLEDIGEAYWAVTTRGDIDVLDASPMQVSWSSFSYADRKRVYVYEGRKMRTEGVARNLVVLSLNRRPQDLVGVGPMQSGRIAGLIAEQAYSQEYFENNAQPTGTLEYPGILTAPEAKTLFDAWEAGQSSRTTGITSGGLTYNSRSFNPQDSEWVNTHLVGVGDVATLFGVPSSMLNYNQPGSSITYQSVGSVNELWWRSTLKPTYARRIERALSDVKGTPIRFDPEELFLAPMRERSESAGVLVRAGFDAAEAADVVGLPPMKHSGLFPITVQSEEALDDPGV